MKHVLTFVITILVANFIVLSFSISAANAHGVGGIEASKTRSRVVAITPNTDLFNVRAVENGERFKITRSSNKDVVILGVDNEPYILINDKGSFVNQKSATRLINDSSSQSSTNSHTKEDFEKTSADPNQIPDWKKVGNSQTYIGHDHRTHYMGSVPNGVDDLGKSFLNIKSGEQIYRVTFAFYATTGSPYLIYGPILLCIFIAILAFAYFQKNRFTKIMNRALTISFLIALGVLESIHAFGYVAFSNQSFIEEFGSIAYSMSLIVLSVLSALRLINSAFKGLTWDKDLSKQAPLLCLTGFVGVFVGTVFEYKTFTYPYLPTIFSPLFSVLLVSAIAILSTLLFVLGMANIKSGSHIEEPLPASVN